MDILSNVHWSNGARNVLKNFSFLDLNKKTALFLRHSAREEPIGFNETIKAPLTSEGIDAAIEFGTKLPSEWNYRIYTSPVQRCVDTGKYIQEGIVKNNIEVINSGILPNLTLIKNNSKEFLKLFSRDQPKFLDYWIAGFYSEEIIESSFDVARRLAQDLILNQQKKDSNLLDIYISHDFHLLLFLFYWSGKLATKRWIGYLDGFFVQFDEESMKFIHHENMYTVPYPDWWEDF